MLPSSAAAGRAGGFLVGGTYVPPTGTYLSPARAAGQGREKEEGELSDSEEDDDMGLFD